MAFLGPIGLSWGLGSGLNTVFGSSHRCQPVFFSKSSSKRKHLNSSGWPGGWVAGFYKNITNSAQTEVGAGAELDKTQPKLKLELGLSLAKIM